MPRVYIRARHEATNGRLHKFKCLSTAFRHDLMEHQDFFHTCCVIVNLEIIHGIATQFDVVPKPGDGVGEYYSYETPTPDVEEENPEEE